MEGGEIEKKEGNEDEYSCSNRVSEVVGRQRVSATRERRSEKSTHRRHAGTRYTRLYTNTHTHGTRIHVQKHTIVRTNSIVERYSRYMIFFDDNKEKRKDFSCRFFVTETPEPRRGGGLLVE